MSKKKKDLKVLERRIISLIRSFPNREFNYKKIAFSIKVNDQKGRDDIVMVLNSLLKKEKIINRLKLAIYGGILHWMKITQLSINI